MNVEILHLGDAEEIGHPIRHIAPAGFVAHALLLHDGAIRLEQGPDVYWRAARLARKTKCPPAGDSDLDNCGFRVGAHEAVTRLAIEHRPQRADEGRLAAIVRPDQRIDA